MPSPEFPPLLELVHRADLDVLVGRWNYQPDPAALPPAYERLTASAVAAGCCYWLQDIRRRSSNDPAIAAWLLAEYFPGMARRLGGRLCVAYLVSPALQQSIEEAPGFFPLATYAGRPFAVGFFGDEGAAIRWLQTEQQAAAN